MYRSGNGNRRVPVRRAIRLENLPIHRNWLNPECFTEANYGRVKQRNNYAASVGDRYKPHPRTNSVHLPFQNAKTNPDGNALSGLPDWNSDAGTVMPGVSSDENTDRGDFDLDLSGD